MQRAGPSRALASAAASALLLAALTACASDGQVTDEPLPVLDTLNGSGSDDAKDEPEVGDEVGIKKFVARLERGAERTKQGHLTFTMSGGAFRMTGSGDVDYSVQPAEMSLDMQLFGAQAQLVAVDGVIYLKRPGTLGKYFRYEPGNPLNPFESGPASRVDPADSLADFDDGITSVTYVGQEDVEGVSVERYEMLVDTRAAGGARDLPPEMTMGVWLDGQDRLARFFMQLGPVASESTLTDFDKPVHVQAPPADQVLDAPAS